MAGDVLSQNEIDALLSALSTGEMDADELKKKIKNSVFVHMILNAPCVFQKIRFAV